MCHPHYVPRLHPRYQIEIPITFAKHNTDNLYSARMLNISDGGMYFESKYPVKTWSDVCIWIEKNPSQNYGDIQIFDFYRSRVLWWQEIKHENILGIGVKHINRSRFVSGPQFLCALCETIIPSGKVHFYKEFVYICPDCHQELKNCSGKNKDELIRILEGNVF